MDLSFSKIVDRERKAEMLLYGVIGEQINGHDFARELNWLGKDYDEIKIRINSDGGSISEGLSIIAEMIASPANIIAQVDGVAASMAAVVLAAADRVIINDYAKVMIHSPYYADDNGGKIGNLSAKDQRGLSMLKDSLVTLLSKRGITQEEITRMMKTDTWFTADEAVAAKLADEIIATGRKKEFAGLDIKKLVAKIQTENSNQKRKNMDKILARLGLGTEATQEQAVEAIDKLAKPEVKPNAVLVDKLIALGKKSGRVTDKNEAKVKALAETDMDLFCDFVGIDEIQADKGERLSDLVAQAVRESGKNPGPKAGEKNFAWYEKNNPTGLAKMEISEPEKFKKLKEADEANYQ